MSQYLATAARNFLPLLKNLSPARRETYSNWVFSGYNATTFDADLSQIPEPEPIDPEPICRMPASTLQNSHGEFEGRRASGLHRFETGSRMLDDSRRQPGMMFRPMV